MSGVFFAAMVCFEGIPLTHENHGAHKMQKRLMVTLRYVFANQYIQLLFVKRQNVFSSLEVSYSSSLSPFFS